MTPTDTEIMLARFAMLELLMGYLFSAACLGTDNPRQTAVDAGEIVRKEVSAAAKGDDTFAMRVEALMDEFFDKVALKLPPRAN